MSQDQNIFETLYENYDELNKKMVSEIEVATIHGGLTGSYREESWLAFFRSIIPMKYAMAQGVIIMDSQGKSSKEVDIAVYDEQYTPYVFKLNNLKIIPIEAVVVAIECKSTDYDTEALINWSNAIGKLEPAGTGIARTIQGHAIGLTNKAQSRTRPIRIVTCIRSAVQEKTIDDWMDELGTSFDFLICQQHAPKGINTESKFVIRTIHQNKTLHWWANQLNHYIYEPMSMDKPANTVAEKEEITTNSDYLRLEHFNDNVLKNLREKIEKDSKSSETVSDKSDEQWLNDYTKMNFIEYTTKVRHEGKEKNVTNYILKNTLEDLAIPENPFITLNLQLNQLLMLINNPMLFPHFAYAAKFKEVAEKKEVKKENEKK